MDMKRIVFIIGIILMSIYMTSCEKETKQDSYNYNTSGNGNTDNHGSGGSANQGGAIVTNGHEYVDLGLSVYWATCNIGASNRTSSGDMYAFGETTVKSEYTASNYTGGNADVVKQKWGGDWRLPTKEEIEELKNKCSWEQRTIDGTVVRVAISPNGNYIVVPYYSRHYVSAELGYVAFGGLWSSTEYSNTTAYCLLTGEDGVGIRVNDKYTGRNTRGVIPNPNYNGGGNSGGGNGGGGGATNYERPEIGLVDYTCYSTRITVKYRIYNQSEAQVSSAKVYYGTSTTNNSVTASVSGSLITANISGLQRNTSYYIKCTATGPGGSTTSEPTRIMTSN